MKNQRRKQILRAAASLAALLIAPAMALAQQYEKVEEAVRERPPATTFIAVAYGFIWVAVLVYVLYLARGLGRVNGDLDDLRRKLGGDGASKRA